MSWLQGIVLGLVQGLTEFLPVSSSGHLILTPVLFHWPDQGLAFDTVLHLGTLSALLWFFWADLWRIWKEVWLNNEVGQRARVFVLKVFVAMLPALVLAAIFNELIDAYARHAQLVAFDLAFWACFLLAADLFAAKGGWASAPVDLEKITWKQVLAVGLAQPLSLLPGTSRSGITITAGLFAGLSRATAARFSFFVSIPITAIAGLHGVWQMVRHPMPTEGPFPLFLGFLTAALAGALAIKFLLHYVANYRYTVFVVYRWFLALLVLWIV